MQTHLYHQKMPEDHSRRNFVFSSTVAALTAAGIGATAAAVTAGAVTAATIGLGAYAVNRLTQPRSQPAAAGTPAAVKEAEPSVEKAKIAAAADIKKKRTSIARNRTIYTGPLGLSDADKSNTTLKTLTGV